MFPGGSVSHAACGWHFITVTGAGASPCLGTNTLTFLLLLLLGDPRRASATAPWGSQSAVPVASPPGPAEHPNLDPEAGDPPARTGAAVLGRPLRLHRGPAGPLSPALGSLAGNQTGGGPRVTGNKGRSVLLHPVSLSARETRLPGSPLCSGPPTCSCPQMARGPSVPCCGPPWPAWPGRPGPLLLDHAELWPPGPRPCPPLCLDTRLLSSCELAPFH